MKNDFTKTNNVLDIVEEKNKRDRIKKTKSKTNFTLINTDCLQDRRISDSGLGVLAYLMSLPSDWIICVNHLCKRFNRSRGKMYSTINELIKTGYMIRYQERNENGIFGEWITEATDDPNLIKTNLGPMNSGFQPQTEKPDPVFTGSGEMYTTKNTNNKVLINNNNKDKNCQSDNNEKITKSGIEPDGSVVVALMERIKYLAVSRVLVTSWLKKYGLQYVLEKIDLIEIQKPYSPEGFLNKAIAEDWKPALPRQPDSKQESSSEPIYPSHDENIAWYNSLTEEDKIKYLQMASFQNSAFEGHLKHHNISVLHATFFDHSLFKMMMGLLGRAK